MVSSDASMCESMDSHKTQSRVETKKKTIKLESSSRICKDPNPKTECVKDRHIAVECTGILIMLVFIPVR